MAKHMMTLTVNGDTYDLVVSDNQTILAEQKVKASIQGQTASVTLERFLLFVVQTLDALEVPFMLTGSLAAAYHGSPPATQDVDALVREASRPTAGSYRSMLIDGWT